MLAHCGIGPGGNLGPRERDRRLRTGVITSTLSLAVAIGLVHGEVGLGWRVLLVVPFFLAANFVVMGLTGT